MAIYSSVFSEFEVKQTSIKFADAEGNATAIGCVGTLGEEMNTKTITKRCEGIIKKQVVKGDGTGELTLSAHIKENLKQTAFGMLSDGFKDGVYAYGRDSVHKPFTLTCEVFDEDGNRKLKAYPNCVVTSGKASQIENGAEEVAEIELTIAVMPDDDGNGVYECIVQNDTDATMVASWLSNFSTSLVEASA